MLTNYDLEKMVDTTDEWITSRTGIKERRLAAPDEFTSDLATKAAQRAMKMPDSNADDSDEEHERTPFSLFRFHTRTVLLFFICEICIICG